MPSDTNSGRLRKAWRVTVKGYDDPATIYAATAGRARMDVWRSMDNDGIRIVDIAIRRWHSGDVVLPRPWLRSAIDEKLWNRIENPIFFRALGTDPESAFSVTGDYLKSIPEFKLRHYRVVGQFQERD